MSLLELLLLLIALLLVQFMETPLLGTIIVWLFVIIVVRVASPYLQRRPAP